MSLRKSLLIILPLLVIAAGIGLYMYNKPHADLHASEADFKLKAAELLETFSNNETDANAKYLNKIVEVSGVVVEKEVTETGDVIVFLKEPGEMFGVSCAFVPEQQAEAESLQTGEQTTIKGVCTGMLMDVSLSRCVVAN